MRTPAQRRKDFSLWKMFYEMARAARVVKMDVRIYEIVYLCEAKRRKLQKQLREAEKVVPHKLEFRGKLIEQLRQAGISEAGKLERPDALAAGSSAEHKDSDIEALTKLESSPSSSWLSKINPFGKKETLKSCPRLFTQRPCTRMGRSYPDKWSC